jgi:Nif-specific regulatory protein
VHRFGRNELEFVTAISGYIALALESRGRLASLENENRSLREEVKIEHQMVGQSEQMHAVYKRIARIAPTDATVLIRGETGTGKELAARAIHRNSPRAAKPFMAINCALLSQTLLESELFGHEKGAFTGAIAQKKGKLELADGGTVFLDELGELPEATQCMLLRVLQERTFERVGGIRPIQVDIRIVAATNKDLETAIKEKTFREDLYYRINVVSLSLPLLMQRSEDIPQLVQHFLHRASEKNKRAVSRVSPQAMAYLQGYCWPGNVRELENAIEHAVVFGSTDEVQAEDLPEKIIGSARSVSAATAFNYHKAVHDAKRQIVLNIMRQCNGNYTEAAKLLQLHPSNLHRLIRDLELKTEIAGFQPI